MLNDRPELRGQAIVLYEANRGLRVVDCSRIAAEYGARKGIPLAEACALVGTTQKNRQQPSSELDRLHTIPYDPVIDRSALEELACQCERFTPIVGLEQTCPAECLLLDITGCERAFRGEHMLAREIETACCQWGYRVRIGLGETVGAAWALARYSHYLRPGPNSGAEPGGPIAFLSPDCCQIAAGQTAAALGSLPVSCLRLEPATVGVLKQLGVETVSQLTSLPREGLTSRFGPGLLLRLQQALGEKSEVVHPYRGMPTLQAQWEFDAPIGRMQIVEQVLLQLLEHLIPQFPAGYGSQRLEIQLGGDGQEKEFVLEAYTPSACCIHWRDLLRLRLETVRLAAPVAKVVLQATALAPLESRQMELFTGAARERPEESADLLDRLSSRLGRQAVLRPRWVADVQPEYACRYTPVLREGQEKASRRKGKKPGLPLADPTQATQEMAAYRPLRLSAKPIALPVVSVVPEGPPLKFCWQDREYQIAHAWGPERIETGWWRGQRIARDYYRVETQTGHRFWLFRRLRDGQWFLHGWFD